MGVRKTQEKKLTETWEGESSINPQYIFQQIREIPTNSLIKDLMILYIRMLTRINKNLLPYQKITLTRNLRSTVGDPESKHCWYGPVTFVFQMVCIPPLEKILENQNSGDVDQILSEFQ